MDPDRQFRVRSKTFWRDIWHIERRTRARAETIRCLLRRRGINIQLQNGGVLGYEPPETWMTASLAGVASWPTVE